MDQLSLIKQLCAFFASVFSKQAEFVVHDMYTGKIVFIANGEITGREVGTSSQASTLRLIFERAQMEEIPGSLIGYRSLSAKGRPLRASNLFFKDEEGNCRYSVCVNQDMTGIEQLQGYIDSFIGEKRLPQPVSNHEETVDNIIMNIMLDEMEQVKPLPLDNREAKLAILRRLDEKGVFEVRHAGPKVCELLQIAQPTLYKYLKEIRQEENET